MVSIPSQAAIHKKDTLLGTFTYQILSQAKTKEIQQLRELDNKE